MNRPATRQSGFSLLMTLLLLAMAGIAMSGVCRLSMGAATQAVQAQEDLQRRWGVLSLQAAALPQAERLIAAAEEKADGPLVSTPATMTLGGQSIELVFADEQAKANINAIYRRRDPSYIYVAAQALLSDSGGQATVEPRPYVAPAAPPPPEVASSESTAEIWPVFSSFDQLYAGPSPQKLFGDQFEGLTPATVNVTLWGSGKINFRRASAVAMLQVCEPDLGYGQITQLLNFRGRGAMPNASLGKVLEQLKLSDKQRSAATRLLTDRSDCHSLLVIVTTPQRRWYQLAVREQPQRGQPRTFCLSW